MSTPGFYHQPTGRRTDERIPAILLKAIVAMVLFTLVLVTVARLTGATPAATPNDDVAIVQERLIQIMGTIDGGAKVSDDDGTVIADLGPMEAGFISGVHRALARERMLQKIEGNPPVRIVRFADGRLGLRDPATGWRVELISFGDTNREAFAALLE
jgi:putative photosynthetic complex assembly protein